jgi:hypothetical protein
MTKMGVFWALIYFGNLVAGLRHPIFPMMAYLIFYYMPPHLNWWGKQVPDLRYSLLAAAVITLSVFLNGGSVERMKKERNPAMAWMLAWGANSVLVTGWALNAARSWIYTTFVLKLVLLYALIPAAVRTRPHFDAFATVHVVGAAYWGYKAWDNPKREAGRLAEVGGPDTQNDNQAAGHLVTVIPFVVMFVLTEKRKLWLALYGLTGAFVLNVFVLCNSRGATVGLAVAVMAAIATAGKGKRKKLVFAAIAGVAAILFLADPEFIERQQTTMNAQDGSAQSRKAMWWGGVEMVKDYPFGGGGRTFHQLSPRYIPEVLALTDAGERSPHNTYIQLATDWGLQGTAVYFMFMFMTVRMLHDIRRRTPGDLWFVYRSIALESALAGTMAAAFFSNRLLGESIYWLCALSFVLHRMQSTEMEALAPVTVKPESAAVLQPAIQPALARDARG